MLKENYEEVQKKIRQLLQHRGEIRPERGSADEAELRL